MGIYRDQVLPRVMDVVLSGAELGKVRARVASGLSGVVLEVGFGSGLNVPYYPSAVERVLAVEPSSVGWKLAARRTARSHATVEHLGLGAEHLPVETGEVDCVLTTWTMCTIPAIGEALSEMWRVLRTGGRLHFVEHGCSPDPKVARWQDRLNPLQGALAGGCNLNRVIDKLVEQAGFRIAHLDKYYFPGPKVVSYFYEGVAVR